IRSPRPPQECFHEALVKEFLSFLPILMTCQCQLIEIAADFAGWENERMRKRLRAGVDWSSVDATDVQSAAVVVTIAPFGWIDPRTLAARLRHSSFVLSA